MDKDHETAAVANLQTKQTTMDETRICKSCGREFPLSAYRRKSLKLPGRKTKIRRAPNILLAAAK